MWRALYLFFFGDTVAALSRDSWISARQQGNQQAVTTGTDALLPPISSLSPLSSDLLVSEKGITYFWAPVLTQSSNGERDCEGLGQAWIKRTTEWKSTNVGFGGRKPAVLMRARPRPRRPGWDEGMSQKAVATSFLSLSLSPHPSHGIMGALDSLALPGLGQVGRGRDAGEAASLAAEMTTVTPIAD